MLCLCVAVVITAPYIQLCFAKPTKANDTAKVMFTPKEQEYIDSHKDTPLVVAASTDMSPLEFYDAESKQFDGLVIKLYDLIAGRTGLHFIFVARGSNEQTKQAIAAGEIQMVGSLNNSPAVTSALGIIPSAPFYHNTISLISKSTWGGLGKDEDIVAVKAGYPVFAKIARQLGYSKIVEYDSFEACVEAVNDDVATLTLISTTSENVLLGHSYYKNLTSILLAQTDAGYSFGIADNADAPLLLSIINKAIATIPQEDIIQMRMQNVLRVKSKRNYRDFLYDHSYEFFFGVIVIVLAIVGIQHQRMVQKRNINKLLAAKNLELETALAAKREALQVADQANSAKSEFFARMSHDLRTPLNAVLGFVTLAMDEPNNPPTTQDYLEKIHLAGKYQLHIINDILDMAKIESGKLELNLAITAGNKLHDDMATIFREQASEKGIKLRTDFTQARAKWLYLDDLRLRQIYANLLSNAIKFSQSGTEVSWRVRDIVIEDGMLYYESVISDQGCGMSKEFMTKLFEPFAQEHAFNAALGTGLGLSIVKHLVDLMGGTIKVTSEVGRGTTFTLQMKVKIASPQEAMQSHSAIPSSDLQGCHILLCEDNKTNTLVAQRLLEKVGCTVDTAENGKLGVDYFEASPLGAYAAILMDIRMPVMNGLEATAKIRALPRTDAQTIPIIAMTANAFNEDVKKCLAAGMNAHVAKPIDVQYLYDVLKEQIQKYKLHN